MQFYILIIERNLYVITLKLLILYFSFFKSIMAQFKTNDFQLDQLNQLDQLIQLSPVLPLQDETEVRNTYGAPPSIEIIPPLNPKPVDESITDAGKYMIKMQKKGFVKLQENTDNPNQIYQSSIIKYNKNKKESQENIQRQEKPKKVLESYQTFWQTSDIVNKTVAELNELQFENNFEHLETENRFRDQVASFVRIMKHNGMLESANKSRSELLNITKTFVNKVKEIRKSMFYNYLSKNILLYSKLNKKQKKEFIEFKPKNEEPVIQKQSKKEEKLDYSFFNRIRQASNLPKSYQMSNLGLDDSPLCTNRVKLQKEMKQLAASMHSAVEKVPAPILSKYEEETELKKTPRDDQSIPRKRVNIIMTPKINRKSGKSVLSKRQPLKPPVIPSFENQNQQQQQNSSLPKLTQKQIYNNFWENQDPLAEVRQGFAPNALQIIEELAQKTNKDYVNLFSPDSINSNQNKIDNNSSEQFENLDDEFDDQIQFEKCESNNNSNLKDNIFSTSVQNLKINDEEINVQNTMPFAKRNYIFDPKSDDIQYLIQQSGELENGDMSQAIYKQLESIWANLGFSVTQKLQMVIKYSESPEESSKLNSSLKFWEEANNSAINYQKVYTAYKDFLKYSYNDNNENAKTVSDLNKSLSESENNLLQVAKTLKSMFGDDLVFHGKKVDDIIKTRRLKLKTLQQKSKITIEEDHEI